jgi:hypothetical protein
MRGWKKEGLWAGLEIGERLAAKLVEQFLDGTGCFNGAFIIARDLKVLRNLTFRAIRELTCSLYVPAGGNSYLPFSDQFCPRPPLRVAWH